LAGRHLERVYEKYSCAAKCHPESLTWLRHTREA
jgi:hypothetical protein